MWESPINVMEIQDSFVSETKEEIEEMVFTEIKRIGIDVNKEELIKALMYDREQYSKGYSDGYNKAIDDFAEKLKYELNGNIIPDKEKFTYARKQQEQICHQNTTLKRAIKYVDYIAEQLKGENNE